MSLNCIFLCSAFELSVLDCIKIASDIATAVNFLHRHLQTPYVHRDIKSANVVLTGGDRRGRGITAKVRHSSPINCLIFQLCELEYLERLPPDLSLNSQHDQLSRRYLLSSLGISESGARSKLLDVASASRQNSFLPTLESSASFGGGERTRRPTSPRESTDVALPFAAPSIGTLQWMAPEMFGKEVFEGISIGDEELRPSDSISRDVLRGIQRPISSSLGLGSRQLDATVTSYQSAVLKFYSEKVDVYSYGMLLWEIFARTLPYLGVDGLVVR